MKLSFKNLPMIIVILSLVISVLNVQPVSSKAYQKPDKSARVPDVLIVQLKEGFSLEEDSQGNPAHRFKTESSAIGAALESLDVQSVKPLFPPGQFHKVDATDASGLTRIYILRFKKSTDIDAALEVLSPIADIEFVELDYVATAEPDDDPGTTETTPPTETPTPTETSQSTDAPLTVNDPRYAEHWALPTIGAPSAWAELPVDAPKVTVAVIDSGICASHPELAGRILNGWDFLESDSTPQDDFGHGCSVAGIIAANMNNGIGIAGVAPNAQIMPLRVLNASGAGSYSDVAPAIVYAADNGAQVINLSLGGLNPSMTLESAINYAISKGVIVIASAGNSGTEGALYPAAYPGVIAVGSVDSNLQHSSFSNYGSQIDIWAPGCDILTTKLDGSYGLVSGTSFAAPYVAGAQALDFALGENLMPDSGLLVLNITASQPTQTVTATPTPTQLPTIAPTLSSLDPASAGSGVTYRAQIQLKQPTDLKRLRDWNVKVLEQGNGIAVVQVTPEQLSKLARLGFKPTQIDSVDYMLTVQSLTTGEVLLQSDVTPSAKEIMALASVDTDSDGLTDTEEAWWCTDPNDNNSDSALAPSPSNPSDGDEVQAILDGVTAYGPPFALWPQFTPHNPSGTCPDGDYDSVPDSAEEFVIGTSILRESTDLDKFDDGQELFGRTFCTGSSGPCGYGILPRAEDSAYVSATMPNWVLPPGNSPFVAAFPEPEVEVVPSSLNLTRVTTITTSEGTMQGTEKTYGTSSTKGTSTSVADTITWNQWEEVSKTRADTSAQSETGNRYLLKTGASLLTMVGGVAELASCGVTFGLGCALGLATFTGGVLGFVDTQLDAIDQIQNLAKTNKMQECLPNPSDLQCKVKQSTSQEQIDQQAKTTNSQDITEGMNGTNYKTDSQSKVEIQKYFRVQYPAFQPTITTTTGKEWGGAQTTTTSEYEEQTISESSTNQYSNSWSTAIAIDSSHAADLRFTYNIINNGTEYAREVTNLTFNVYIGNNPNPAYTYVAVGSTGQIAKIENLFPGDELTYTSNPIALTLDEMRAIDEGASVRVVMEDITFGQDQVFYLDAMSGSVLVAMEDGFDDNDEVVDSYVIPVWNPSDSLQDVIKRYFPVTEDEDGNLLSISTPEFNTNPPTFVQHALTGTSWWNIYLSDGLNYNGVFSDTLAQPNTTVLVRIVSDRDLDGYNDRTEIRIGTDPDDPASHPSPNLIAGYTTSCTGDDCTVRMVLQNIGNYDAYGVEAVMYSPDGLANITNNTIGGSGRVPAGERIVVGPSDTFQYTKSTGSVEPVIVISYNDPQGNHRFILPSGNYPTGAQIATLDDVITALDGKMLLDPGVDISSISSNQAGFVINSPHPTSITSGKLFVEYIDGNGNVLHEDVTTQTFESGPTVIPQTINLGTYPPETTILLAFFTDSAGNIIDSSARPLASFGPDPSPEANVTVGDWEIGAQSVISVPNPWNLGTFEPGTTLHARLYLTNTGLGNLRYSLTGLGNGWSIAGNPAGTLGPTQQNVFELSFDSAGIAPQTFNHSLYLRTNDPANGTIVINLQATIGTPAGTASAYQVNPYKPWDQFVYVPGPHNQNDIVNFTHTLADDPSRMFPLYLYNESGTTLKGIGEYGVDFSGQTAPFGVFGTGADGDLTVTSGQTIYTDNTRSAVSATANSAQPNISLSSGTEFVAGQEVLIMQVQGTGAGTYEFANIASVGGNNLTLTKNLTNTYTVGGSSKAQVIRMMQYHDVTVQSGGILTAHAWNGNTGGIVAFRASGTVNVFGKIDSKGLGFAGAPARGYGTSLSGESYDHGILDLGYVTCPAPISGEGSTVRSDNLGGSGGGYGSNGFNGGGNCGYGGNPYGTAILENNAFLGSGGGAASWGNAGAGGGAILIYTRDLSLFGQINADGADGGSSFGYGTGGAGGGSGGSILLVGHTANIGSGLMTAIGGSGGIALPGGYNGGNGGFGRVRIKYSTISGTTNPSASLQQMNFYSITGQGAPFGVFGNGSDGDLTVTNGQTIYTDNVRSALASTAVSGQSNITISSATGFTTGKEVLIIQVQGIGAGTYEFAAITSVNGNTLTLSKPLGSTYTTGGNSKAQVLVMPQYHDVTVQSGGTLTAHAWDGTTGGIVAFRINGAIAVSGTITVTGKGFRGGSGGINVSSGYQGEGSGGLESISINANGNGGGGGGLQTGGGTFEGPGGGGGSNGTEGTNGNNVGSTGIGGTRGGVASNSELTILTFGGGGGGGSGISQYSANRGYFSTGGLGGNGGGIVLINAQNIVITGSIVASGSNGGGATGASTFAGAGGGGAGGSVLIKAYSATLGSNLINFTNGTGAIANLNPQGNGGNGGAGRIRIEYSTMTGTTNPVASTQQVNYYNLTGSSSNTLYVPDTISAGNNARYKLLYGQRSVNTTAGDQLYSVHLANHQYSAMTLSALVEQVVGSGSTFNFCLDFGNDGTCDYTANNQAFIGPVRLDATNLTNALNAYITAQTSTAPVLTIPIRVNISTPADIFLFNLSTTPLSGIDLQPSVLTIAPQNGNPANNILEGTLVDLSTTATNNGTTNASNFTIAFYLGDPANSGTLIGSKFIQSLAAGATSSTQTVVWNTSGLLGAKTIYVKVDPSDAVSESNETNNVASAPAVIKKKPDLIIISLDAPNVRVGEVGSANVVVKNDGEADVTGAVVRLYLGTNTSGSVLGNVNVDVPQGQSVTAQIPFTINSTGDKALFVKVDPANVIIEANEQNNTGTGNTKVGWNLLTVDAGGANDTTYSASAGYGWMTQGTVVTTCGTQIQQSYRQAGSAETLQYKFDNLIPGRRYHLDLTFATCSGERYLDLFVDGTQMAEAQATELASASISPVHVTSTPYTVSLLLDPASYATDGSILLSISRNSGLSGPLVNIIDLQEVKYCYLDSGPGETPWSADNECGYDSSWTSDGFNGWGTLPYETMRFGEDSVKYKFSNLAPAKKYNLRMTYYEEDNAARVQRVTFDGASPSSTFTIGSTPTNLIIPIPASSYTDTQIVVAMERPGGGEAVVNEVTLEEDSRAENNRYQVNTYALAISKTGTGSGTVTSNPTGINCGSTCSYSFSSGTVVTLTAMPTSPSTFGGWSGGGCSGTGTCTVTLSSTQSVTATFNPPGPQTLSVSTNGTGSGTVTSSPVGIDCGSTCSYAFAYNTVVTLTATPTAPSTFGSWSGGGCSGTGTCIVTMSSAQSVTATFNSPGNQTLSVSTNGTGSGMVTSNPAGINCGSTCSYSFSSGTVVTLTAMPTHPSTFGGWSGGGCSGTGSCTVTLSSAQSVTATFNPPGNQTLTVNKSGTGSGMVTSFPTGISCGSDCTEDYGYNTEVTLTATNTAGSTFAGWSGACSGTDSCVVSMTSAKFVTASFAIDTTSAQFYSVSTYDGWVLESGETTSKGGSLDSKATTFRLGDDKAKKQYRGILSFSTKGLPDTAVITKVTLKIRKQGIVGGGNPVTTFQGFMVDIKKGYFGTSALQTADFQTTASKTYGPFKPALYSNWYSIDLTSGKNYINKVSSYSGLTQIRLRFKLDDNNNTIANYLSLYSGNASSSSYRPQLVIEYYVPVP
jgi:hypothetical protein